MSQAQTREKLTANGFIALLAVHLMVDAYGGFWAVLKHKDLANLNLYWAGVIATAATFLGTVIQPIAGHFADGGRQRMMILLGLGVTSVVAFTGPIGFHMDPTQPAMYVALGMLLLIIRIGQGLFHPAGAALAGSSHATKRSTVLSLFITGGMIGYAASQAIYSGVYRATDGETWWLLIPGIAIGIWFAFACPRHTTIRKHAPSWRKMTGDLHNLRVPLIALYFIQVAGSALMMGLVFLLPELVDSRGYPSWMAHGGAMACLVGGAVLMMTPIAHIADRFGQRRTLAMVLVASAAAYYALVGFTEVPLAVFIILCVLAGGLLSAAGPLGIAYGQTLLPHRDSFISGILMGLAWAMGSFAPMIVGYFASRPDFGVARSLQGLGLLALLAPWCVTLLPKLKKQQTNLH